MPNLMLSSRNVGSLTVRRAAIGRSGLPHSQPYLHHAISERLARQLGQPDDVETRPRCQLPLLRPARLTRAADTGTQQRQSRCRLFAIRYAWVPYFAPIPCHMHPLCNCHHVKIMSSTCQTIHYDASQYGFFVMDSPRIMPS